MLYVRIDNHGNMLAPAQNFRTIQKELASENILISQEDAFQSDLVRCENPKYALVEPTSQPLPTVEAGQKIVPDYPIITPTGQYLRKWKVVDADEADTASFENIQRLRRRDLLQKYVDGIGVPLWDSFSTTEKSAIENFYSILLTLPEHKNWPFVQFPEIPTALKKIFS